VSVRLGRASCLFPVSGWASLGQGQTTISLPVSPQFCKEELACLLTHGQIETCLWYVSELRWLLVSHCLCGARRRSPAAPPPARHHQRTTTAAGKYCILVAEIESLGGRREEAGRGMRYCTSHRRPAIQDRSCCIVHALRVYSAAAAQIVPTFPFSQKRLSEALLWWLGPENLLTMSIFFLLISQPCPTARRCQLKLHGLHDGEHAIRGDEFQQRRKANRGVGIVCKAEAVAIDGRNVRPNLRDVHPEHLPPPRVLRPNLQRSGKDSSRSM
jgi:hypothetical protein